MNLRRLLLRIGLVGLLMQAATSTQAAPATPVPLAQLGPLASPAQDAEQPAEPRSTHDPLADAVLLAINRYRQQAGLSPWVADATLSAIANGHSQAQSAQGRLSHGGFATRFAMTRARMCVENLAAGHTTGQAVVDAWRASPQHQKNLLDPEPERVGLASNEGVVSMLACRFSAR